MVLTWNNEPSPGLNGGIPLPEQHLQVLKFADTNRFVRDGTTRPDRLPNYLNKSDPQGGERHQHYVEGVDTNTHTTIQDRLASAKTVLEMAEHIEKQLWSPPAMKSQRVKSATNKSLLSQDVRFEVLRDTTSEDIGPGHYWIQGGRPDLGPYPATLPSRGTSPARDPGRQSRAFITQERGELFPPSDVPDRTYMSPQYQPAHDVGAAWSTTLPEPARCEVVDWRWQGRVSDTARQVPADAQYRACHMNQSSHLTRIADVAAPSANPTHTFRTKEARLARLPKERLADTRLSRPRSDEDPAALGPGSIMPLISLGTGRRKTYRLFAPQQANGQIAGGGPRGMWGKTDSTPSSSFANTPRGRQAGPYSWGMDSTLTRVY